MISLKNPNRRIEGNGKPLQYFNHENVMIDLEFSESHGDLNTALDWGGEELLGRRAVRRQ